MKEFNLKKHGAFKFLPCLIGLVFSSQAFAWDRIITLSPMVSEWTAEILGKDKVLQKIVGASEYSNYPDYMNKVHTVGPYPQIHVEDILALHPDLIIASTEYNRSDQIEKLKKLKLNVEILPRENFTKMEEWILELGKVLHEENSAERVGAEWKKSLKEIKPPTKQKKAFLEIQFQPLITVGGKSFLNDAFKLVGFENIFENIPQSYPKVSREAVLEKNPDQIFIFEMVKNQEDLDAIKLVWKNSKVQVLAGDDFSRCSPRLLKALRLIK